MISIFLNLHFLNFYFISIFLMREELEENSDYWLSILHLLYAIVILKIAREIPISIFVWKWRWRLLADLWSSKSALKSRIQALTLISSVDEGTALFACGYLFFYQGNEPLHFIFIKDEFVSVRNEAIVRNSPTSFFYYSTDLAKSDYIV